MSSSLSPENEHGREALDKAVELLRRREQLVRDVDEHIEQLERGEGVSIANPLSTGAIRELFQQLKAIWKSETRYCSDLTKIVNHWAYQQIIKMGMPVVPILLHELETDRDCWFAALRKITGADPVPPEARADLAQMAEAWLKWAKDHDIVW